MVRACRLLQLKASRTELRHLHHGSARTIRFVARPAEELPRQQQLTGSALSPASRNARAIKNLTLPAGKMHARTQHVGRDSPDSYHLPVCRNRRIATKEAARIVTDKIAVY